METSPRQPRRRHLTVGGLTRDELLVALEAAGVQFNEYATALLAHPAFDTDPAREMEVVWCTPAELGLAEGGTLAEVAGVAARRGLVACPATTGPYLRLALLDQAEAPDSTLSAGRTPSSAIHVLSEPFWDDEARPRGFYLRVVDGVRWLRGYCCSDGHHHPGDAEFAFQEPARETPATP